MSNVDDISNNQIWMKIGGLSQAVTSLERSVSSLPETLAKEIDRAVQPLTLRVESMETEVRVIKERPFFTPEKTKILDRLLDATEDKAEARQFLHRSVTQQVVFIFSQVVITVPVSTLIAAIVLHFVRFP